MMAKVDVNGAKTHPVWQYLKALYPGPVKWNFDTHFLVARNGTVLCPSFAPCPIFGTPSACAQGTRQSKEHDVNGRGQAPNLLSSLGACDEQVVARYDGLMTPQLAPKVCVYVRVVSTLPHQKVRISPYSLSSL